MSALEWEYRHNYGHHYTEGWGWQRYLVTKVGPATYLVQCDSVQGYPSDHWRVFTVESHGSLTDAQKIAQDHYDSVRGHSA